MQPPARNPPRFAPIFLLAPARSYTSVVSMMLGQHPQMLGFPELKLFSYPTLGELGASLPRFWRERGVTHRSPGLVRTVAELVFGAQTLESVASARTWLEARSNWSGADLFNLLLERIHPRLGIEKSPENVETDEALERVAAAYPHARYIHLTRHPVTTQRSIQEHAERIMRGYGQAGQPMAGIAAWYVTHQRILSFSLTLPPERYYRVRAEDVLNDTQSQLRMIAAWLELRVDTVAIEAMAHPERSAFARLGPAESGVTGGNDPAFLRDPIPRRVEVPGAVEQPSGWLEDASVWPVVVALAEQLGYP